MSCLCSTQNRTWFRQSAIGSQKQGAAILPCGQVAEDHRGVSEELVFTLGPESGMGVCWEKRHPTAGEQHIRAHARVFEHYRTFTKKGRLGPRFEGVSVAWQGSIHCCTL